MPTRQRPAAHKPVRLVTWLFYTLVMNIQMQQQHRLHPELHWCRMGLGWEKLLEI
jgi:hypothetical protein